MLLAETLICWLGFDGNFEATEKVARKKDDERVQESMQAATNNPLNFQRQH